MKSKLFLLALPFLILGCSWWTHHSNSIDLMTRSVELSGTLPAVVGTPTVTLGGTPAVVAAGTWQGTVVLDGAQTEVALVVLIDGVPVITRQIAIEIDPLP